MTDVSVKDVARELERRRRRRRVAWFAAWAVAVAVAVLYVRCGRGWGLGSGTGDGSGSGARVGSAEAARCRVRIDAAGVMANGVRVSREGAVVACREVGAAELVVAGDAREGDVRALEAALDAAGIATTVRDPSAR
jgi:hypothetical protein